MNTIPISKLFVCAVIWLLLPVSLQGKLVQTGEFKLRYMQLELPKLEAPKRLELIYELNSYENKVSDVQFDEVSRQLTIWYTYQVTADDLLQVISKYTTDFIKLAGTEWP